MNNFLLKHCGEQGSKEVKKAPVLPGASYSLFPSLALSRSGNYECDLSLPCGKHPKWREHLKGIKNCAIFDLYLLNAFNLNNYFIEHNW